MIAALLGPAVVVGTFGCFAERSFDLDPDAAVRLTERDRDSSAPIDTRDWLRHAHRELAHFLPQESAETLLTGDMTDPKGRPVNVFAHFDKYPEDLQSLWGNMSGIRYSAQAASREYYIDKPAPAWPGFEDIWIATPISPILPMTLEHNGRIGWARDDQGRVIDADCIVVLPGMFGDNGVKRSMDICIGLREAGFHVLSLEPRGHGQTEARYPDAHYTFGVFETDDLMWISDWLQALPHVRRTGLIAYCWTANSALLAAWYDGCPFDDPMIPGQVRPYLIHHDPQKHRYEAGIIAFSPVLRWEVLMDELDRQRSVWKHPIYAAIQDTVRDRMELKGYAEPDGNLRRLVELEHRIYGVPLPEGASSAYSFLRLLPYRGFEAGGKLERARMPVLIVHGADDPLVPAQDVADLMATIDNPAVAAMILPSGGHVGFAGYSHEYYLSLVTNFFDPRTGPAAHQASADRLVENPPPQ